MVCGCLLGVAVHYLRLRQRVLELERQRADELSRRLGKIERDQAVWVISASLLHALKTPLHALGLLLDELLELPEPISEERRGLLERARVQGERLADKLQTLRALPASRELDFPRVELGSVIREMSQPLARMAAKSHVSLEVAGEDPSVRAHPSYLKIILDNLVDNSVDALRGRGQGRVKIEVREHDTKACVSVWDDGPGLSEAARVDLFEPLQTRKAGGLGLGLSTSRQLARAMGGDLISVEVDRGTCFRLTLPAARSEGAA
jgi:signal transduction histidine kinase